MERSLERGRDSSLKTEQEIKKFINQNVNFGRNKNSRKIRKKKSETSELNQMESLILAQDERWRHA